MCRGVVVKAVPGSRLVCRTATLGGTRPSHAANNPQDGVHGKCAGQACPVSTPRAGQRSRVVASVTCVSSEGAASGLGSCWTSRPTDVSGIEMRCRCPRCKSLCRGEGARCDHGCPAHGLRVTGSRLCAARSQSVCVGTTWNSRPYRWTASRAKKLETFLCARQESSEGSATYRSPKPTP